MDALFDTQAALAPRVAAAVVGLAGQQELIAKARARVTSGALDLATEAVREAEIPTTPRLLHAARMIEDAATSSPGSADVWAAATLIHARLAGRLQSTETPAWQETCLRTIVAGEIAAALDPSSARARLARAMAFSFTGRLAAASAISGAEAAASSSPTRAGRPCHGRRQAN